MGGHWGHIFHWGAPPPAPVEPPLTRGRNGRVLELSITTQRARVQILVAAKSLATKFANIYHV